MHNISILFKALSDQTRLRILLMLRVRPMQVCEIREVLRLAISTAAKRLSMLRNAGCIVEYKRGGGFIIIETTIQMLGVLTAYQHR